MLPPFDPWLAGSVAADVWMASRSTGEALAARRAYRLRRLLAAAAQGSRLYRQCLSGEQTSSTPLQALPVAHKAELMRHFGDWVTDPAIELAGTRRFLQDPSVIGEAYLGRYMVWESSGSTGEPGVFVQDLPSMAVYDALEALRRAPLPHGRGVFDPWLLGERIAFVGATGGHFASVVSVERLRRLNPSLARRTRSISFLQPIERLAEELQAWNPGVLATYPSAAMLLAQEQQAGRLKLALQQVWTGGENLTPAMRRHIEEGFGCRVLNSYGASEFLAMAGDCVHGRLHLNSDWFVLEPVDERGRPVPPGVASATTLLTNLANHVQPLIRYDLGDRVTLAPDRCPCGSWLPVVDVQGRRDDTLQLAGTRRRTVPVLPLAISTVLEDDAGLFDFQLSQQGPSELLLSTGERGASAARHLRRARHVLQGFLMDQGAAPVKIHCRSGQPGRRGCSGKIPRIVAHRG
ncbi:phenylacetate--CoA ligase family protein [Ideonella sp. YS5]|uniref:phenylacetate--CoA ligase family protein n=1 Tax=Ideonella sp. YS5 TaxID=3453714 RepID=UPI003EEBD033